MRVLVTGAAGQLGRDVVDHAVRIGDDVIAVDRQALDIADPDAVAEVIGAVSPDVVVNTAAYTAVDSCEFHPDVAETVNATAVGYLREACDAASAHLIQISTDYVFDGTLARPYREDDEPNPQSVYGKTKLGGEVAAGPRATIVRTSFVAGRHGDNMVKLVLRLAEGKKELAFVDDQRGCPTFTADLAVAIHRLAIDRPGELFHVTNAGAVSWYEYVREILATAGEDPDRVRPISTADLDPPRPAPRPANSVLDNAAWRAAGYPPMRDFREPLAEMIAAL